MYAPTTQKFSALKTAFSSTLASTLTPPGNFQSLKKL
jgi:hypothetical protein